MKYEAMERFVRGVEETTSVAPAMPLGTAEFLAEALEGAGFGTWHLDMETGLTTWDAIASKILGYEEVVHTSGELGPVHPDDQARLRDETARCLREGKPYDVQFRGVRADGEIRWLRASAGQPKSQEGKPRHLAGIVADITAKKEADDKLRQAEERHLVVSRAATDLVYEWDIKTGILQWNDALSTYFQHRAEDVSSNVEFFKKLHPDERVSLSARIDGVIDGGGSQFSAEHRLRRADGSYGDVHTSIHVIRDASGGPVRVIGTMHDITERKRADAALRDSEAVNRSIVEASTDVIKLLDLEGRLIFMNGSGADALAIKDLPQFYGSEWAALWPLAARRAVREAVTIANQGGIGRFSEACPTVLGEHRCWDVVVSPVFGGEGGPTKLVAISRDITDRIEAAKLLTWSATHDSLTELPNRAFFQEALARAISGRKPGCGSIALMLLDLDDFKQVNDTLGHDAGDAVLTTFAQRLGEAIDVPATFARLGGDEFAVMIENVTDDFELAALAESVLARMREPFVHAGRILDCHVTIGAALYPEHGTSSNEVLKNADIALYVAKTSQRGNLVIFEPSHRAQVQERVSMVNIARTAVREDRIVPFYQPKILLADNSIHGFEALLRWHHPRLGFQLPATISAAFEDLDVAAAISDKMIDQVIADMARWLDQGTPFGHVAVNAAAAEFRRDNFGESLLQRLERAGVPPSCFHLEVTETVFLGRGSECVERALKLLDSAGVSIALDDFGTGYASLRHLKQFPVHVIKIDQSFVRDMGTDPDDAAIIEAVLNLGRSLNIEVVAEGIETQAQENHLRELGCQYGQGFFYAEALPGDAVPGLFNRKGEARLRKEEGSSSQAR